MRTGAVCILVAILGVGPVTAQQAKPVFEVASVKRQSGPVTLGTAGPRVKPGGVFNPTHATVQSLITFAYDVKPHQIMGSPAWMRRDTFQIDARAGFEASADQIKEMVRSLLADRFKLVARTERRDMQYLAMVVARSDGRLGPYLREVTDDCAPAKVAEARRQFPARPKVAGPLTSGQCTTVSAMVDLLSTLAMIEASVPIVDETGLAGRFVYEMTASSMVPGAVTQAASADPSLPPFTVALEEQLGLKLESRKGPVDVVVIESVSPPTEN